MALFQKVTHPKGQVPKDFENWLKKLKNPKAKIKTVQNFCFRESVKYENTPVTMQDNNGNFVVVQHLTRVW